MVQKALKIFLLTLPTLLSVSSQAQDFIIKNYELPRGSYSSRIYAAKETIWISTYEGIARFNGSSWEYFNKTNGFLIDSVYNIASDAQNTVWFMGVNGVACLKNSKWEYSYLNEYFRYGLLDNTGEALWFQYLNTDLLKITSTDTISFPNTTELIGVEEDSHHNYWSFDSYTTYYLEGDIWKTDTRYGYNWRDDMFHIDKDDNKWLIKNNKILIRKSDSGAYSEIEPPLLLKSPQYKNITSDKYGNIYIGTESHGLIIKSKNTWYHVDSSKGLSNNGEIQGVAIDQSDNVWILMHEWLSDKFGVSVLLNEGWIDNANALHGVIYSDENNNGEQDANEPGIPNQFVNIQPGRGYAISGTDGEFSFLPVTGSNTISVVQKGFWEQGSTPMSFTFTYPNPTLPDFNIGLKWKVVNDVAVSLSSNALRPGFNSNFYLSVKNEGSVEASTTLALDVDPNLTFLSSTVAPSSRTASHLEWSSISLEPFESKSIQVIFNLPPTVPLGTVIKNTGSAFTLSGETDVVDNKDTLKTVVTGSFDPNDKLVAEGISEARLIEKTTRLTYTIRFQNMGTDTAFTVRVKDEIDPNLDITSVKILASSHPMTYTLENRTFNFYFPDIKLPHSTRNEPASHGYVKYSVGPVNGIPDSTVVRNSAAIYFDYNEPVLTNEVLNKFVTELPRLVAGIETPSVIAPWVYPNPVNSTLFLSNDILTHYSTAELITCTGLVIKQFNVNENSGALVLENVESGLYLLRLTGRHKPLVTKIIIAREK